MEDLKIHGAGTYLAVLLSTLGIVVPKTSQLMEQMIFMAQNHLAEVPDEVWMYLRRDDGWRGAQPVIMTTITLLAMATVMMWLVTKMLAPMQQQWRQDSCM